MNARLITTLAATTLLAGMSAGCKSNPAGDHDAGHDNPNPAKLREKSVHAKPVPTVSGAPIARSVVEASINPNHAKPYSGATGTIRGVVTVKGPEAPITPVQIPKTCGPAAEKTYGPLFRLGPNHTAADVLVAVTDYGTAFVPAKRPSVHVDIRDCAFSTRTVALTYGQHVEVSNKDNKSFIPYLIGEHAAAQMVATPGGDAVKLYPKKVGHYLLADNMKRPWMKADVFVLKYATFDVTGLDGAFTITRVPAGKVKVSALLPSINTTSQQSVTVEAGKTVTVNFTLKYDKKAASPSAPSNKKPHPKAFP